MDKFGMHNAKQISTLFVSSVQVICKNVVTYKGGRRVAYLSIVGSLKYAMVCTRSDIAHAVSVSQYMANPMRVHW